MAKIVRTITYESNDVEALQKQLSMSQEDGVHGFPRFIMTVKTISADVSITPGGFDYSGNKKRELETTNG